MRIHKVKHLDGATITSIILKRAEVEQMEITERFPGWENKIYESQDFPSEKKKLKIRSKYFCISKEQE